MLLLQSVLFAPVVFGVLYLAFAKNFVAIASVVALILGALWIFFTQASLQFSFYGNWHHFFTFLDFLLLGYFLYEGLRFKHVKIALLAFVQVLLLAAVLFFVNSPSASDISVDSISKIMYLVVTIVGGAIIIYSLEYLKSEKTSALKKRFFIALLFFFLSVMLFIVSLNSLKLFFLAFELTTLCSYLLIQFRGDDRSVAMAQKALWINQIGGVFILGAMLLSQTLYFDSLIASNMQLALIFLVFAAFVKGAQLPFHTWLLGAMAAPTPVSAILHSATMVKIAPFLVLKLSSGLDFSVAVFVALLGGFVFFTASVFALSKDFIKEILGYSTIGLLGLMIALAAFGFVEAVMTLIVFHAVSKGMLFLQAGMLEKRHGIKYLSQIKSLSNIEPFFVFTMIVAFISLVVPPFGVFSGKFLAIVSISGFLHQSLWVLPVLFFAVTGSVVLTLLYFRIISNIYAKDSDLAVKVPMEPVYLFTLWFFLVLLCFGVFNAFALLGVIEITVALAIFSLFAVIYRIDFFKNMQRLSTYSCGENDKAVLNSYYFDFESRYAKVAAIFSLGIMSVTALWGIYV
jgi:ech hydrogenase subunit A